MAEDKDGEMEGGAALWARYRAGLAPVAAPDALLLAAYAENRLGEAETARVESWLARHPEHIAGLLAARAAAMQAALPLGRPEEIRAARALVQPSRGGTPRQLLRGIAWSSVAAGLLIACLIGYEAGVATGGHTSLALASVAREMGFGAGSNEGLLAMGGGDAGEEL
jgi:ferric-dicitrate binding protein FerR (iron transport regulator)